MTSEEKRKKEEEFVGSLCAIFGLSLVGAWPIFQYTTSWAAAVGLNEWALIIGLSAANVYLLAVALILYAIYRRR